eukprot:2191010-Amphidinium_carterae.1
MVSLDIDEPQILLRFPDDPTEWHHRVLIRRHRDAVWVVLTPDGELQVENLGDYQLLALERGQAVPPLAAGNCYLFGAEGAGELARHHGAARRMAVILGGVQEGDMSRTEASWRIADPAAAEFGTEVAPEIVNNPATAVTRGAVGLAMAGVPARWLAIESVAAADVASWLDDKHSGAGRDSRLCGPVARGKLTNMHSECARSVAKLTASKPGDGQVMAVQRTAGGGRASSGSSQPRPVSLHVSQLLEPSERSPHRLCSGLGTQDDLYGTRPPSWIRSPGSSEHRRRRTDGQTLGDDRKGGQVEPKVAQLQRTPESDRTQLGGGGWLGDSRIFQAYCVSGSGGSADIKTEQASTGRDRRQAAQCRRRSCQGQRKGKMSNGTGSRTSVPDRLPGQFSGQVMFLPTLGTRIALPVRQCGVHVDTTEHRVIADELAAVMCALASPSVGHPLHITTRDIDHARLSAPQGAAIRRLRGLVAEYLPREVMSGKAALTELLHTDDLYAVENKAALRPYCRDRLRVTKGDLQPKEIAQLTSPDACTYISDPYRWMVKSITERTELHNSGEMDGSPYWDASLRRSKKMKAEFLSTIAKAECGCFFVNKKDNYHIRLVVDARWPNKLFFRPPHSELAIPGTLSRLSTHWHSVQYDRAVLERWRGRGKFPGIRPEAEHSVSGFAVDLTDGFYQFKCQRLACFFGLGYVANTEEITRYFGMDVSTVYDDDLEQETKTEEGEELVACFLGLPMGFSWALYYCHESISHSMRSVLQAHQIPANLVGNMSQPPLFTVGAPAMAPYVDNANVLSIDATEERLFDELIGDRESKGFVLREEARNDASFEFL